MCPSIIKPFKVAVDRLATQHMKDNLESYVNGSLTASARRVLFTKWVGQFHVGETIVLKIQTYDARVTYSIPFEALSM